jgi:hypothetical protein
MIEPSYLHIPRKIYPLLSQCPHSWIILKGGWKGMHKFLSHLGIVRDLPSSDMGA